MAIKDWSTTANDNDDADASINWLEGQAPSTVNGSARAMMAALRTDYEGREWRDWGHTVTYASATTFTISGDVTAVYVANRPIKCTDSSTLYGKVASSSYGAPNTTVTVTLDSGSLSASLTAVALGFDPTGDCIDASGVRGVVDNYSNQTVAGNKTFSGNNIHSGTQTISGVATMSAKSLWTAEGADVASASDCNIWSVADGNTVHVTGTTTITDWGAAPQAGAFMWVIFDGALQLTYNATTNKLNTGGSNYTTAAGDRAFIYAESTSSYVVTIFPLDGRSLTGPTNATQVASTSGTTVGFTSIPSWAKKITMMLNGVSTNGSSNLMIQIGDSGGYESTGYISTHADIAAASSTLGGGTSGFELTSSTAAGNIVTGAFTLTLMDAATFTWVLTGTMDQSNGTRFMTVASGSKSLSAALDRIQLTTAGGSDTFDAGTVNILYD